MGRSIPLFAACLSCAVGLTAQPFDSKVFDNLQYRAIGPANMGGRTTDVEGVPGDPNIVYVGTGGGGAWKTVNAGTTWTPLFQREGTFSVGDMALDPKNPDVVWLGSGEANMRNSVSFGDGIYKSTDGGKTWRHLGLKETEHIARVVVNPLNTDTAYVCAIGHQSGPNDERGVFMTTDGGATWAKTLFLDGEHGCSDIDIDPKNPNVLYAALWKFDRKPWNHTSGDEKGGVWKSIDGGRTWNRLTEGLPKLMGRIGVKVAPSNPAVVYVCVESKEGTMYRSDDSGTRFRETTRERDVVSRGFYYADLRVDPTDENRVFAVASNLLVSIDGGKKFKNIVGRTHIDYHALWIDPQDPRRMWHGQDGGISVSYNRGETWEVVNNIPLGQFYQISADNRLPFYHVTGGLQDNGTWSGPSRTREPAGILNDDWTMVSFGDGFHVVSNPDDPDVFVSESQGGSILVTNTRTREQRSVTPQPRRGWVRDLKYRFHWNTPIVPSPHEKNTLYFGSNVLFQSPDFGKSWEPISTDLTTNDPEKLKPSGGPVWLDNSTAENHCTIISIAESPVKAGNIWVGTDDGNLQLTTDGGRTWTNLSMSIEGLPANSPVSHVEPSRTGADIAYAAFDRHLLDDYRPLIYKTADRGKTWRSISGNLPPKAYVHILREDPKNQKLLYAGTELGVFASWDGGEMWTPLLLENLSRVAVHDIVIHPRENDLILGTHGRSIMIFDDATPIQQMSRAIADSDAYLFDVRPALRFTTRFTRYGIGGKVYTGPNPAYGAIVTYYLKAEQPKDAALKLEVLDASAKVIREVKDLPRKAGLNRIAWDLRLEGPKVRMEAKDGDDEEEEELGRGPRGPQALPGLYTLRLTAAGQTLEAKAEVRMDPSVRLPQDDLQSQFKAAVKLNGMVSSTNDLLRRMDSLDEQLQQMEKLGKQLGGEKTKQIAALIANARKDLDVQIRRIGSKRGGSRLETPPALADGINGLFRTVDSPNSAPTDPQLAYLGELEREFAEKSKLVNADLFKLVPQWNEALHKQGLPGITAW